MVGAVIRPLFGSNWDNSANCRSQGANWNNASLNLNSNNGSRGVADTKGLTLRLTASTRPKGQILIGGPFGLVGRSNAQRGVL